MVTIINMITVDIIMTDEQYRLPSLALLRMQSWLSPAFPTGSYSYSHGLEWAVEAGPVPEPQNPFHLAGGGPFSCPGGKLTAFFFQGLWPRPGGRHPQLF